MYVCVCGCVCACASVCEGVCACVRVCVVCVRVYIDSSSSSAVARWPVYTGKRAGGGGGGGNSLHCFKGPVRPVPAVGENSTFLHFSQLTTSISTDCLKRRIYMYSASTSYSRLNWIEFIGFQVEKPTAADYMKQFCVGADKIIYSMILRSTRQPYHDYIDFQAALLWCNIYAILNGGQPRLYLLALLSKSQC